VLGNAFAMRIVSGVEFSESSVIVDVAMEGTALFSSWFTFEKPSKNDRGMMKSHQSLLNGNGTVTLINGGERIEVLIRFCPKVSYLSTCCGSNTCDKRTMPVTSHHKRH
jgi:hypothetical protein